MSSATRKLTIWLSELPKTTRQFWVRGPWSPQHVRDHLTNRLEFAVFSGKSMVMSSGGQGRGESGRGRGPRRGFALALLLVLMLPAPLSAQLFSDRPPPIPPAPVPEPPAGPAMNLAPPSGPASIPNLPAPLTQPSTPLAAVPAAIPAPGLPAPNQGVLALTARFGKDLPVVTSGLVWRIFSDRPDETGNIKLVREDRGATPNIALPPGNYVVHVALGLVSAVRPVTLKAETDRESFILPAGGLRIEGRVGTSKIPQNQISFSIYKGSQFEAGERASLVPNVRSEEHTSELQ